MEKSGKRGKIPQSDWPLIMARYEGGETLSSIARTYDCSPPAISYIVSRSKAKPAGEVSAQPAPEAHLLKSAASSATNGSATVEPTPPPVPAAMIRREPIGDPRPAAPPNGVGANGDQRHKLHLGLGSNGNGGNGHAPVTAGANGGGPSNGNGNGYGHDAPRPNIAAPRPSQPQATGEHMAPRPFPAPPRNSPPFDGQRNGRDLFAMPEGRPMAQQPREAEGRKDNASFIDQELRNRVDGDIAAFLAAFDAALAADTQESRFGLREATDRLLRAGARTRIELERLEARVPLSPREAATAAHPGAWRHR